MKELVRKTIEDYYFPENKEEYLLKCKKAFSLPVEIINIINKYNYLIKSDIKQRKASPSARFRILLGNFADANFQVKYEAEMVFSRLANICSLEYFYKIKSFDPKSISPNFYHGTDEPLTVPQFDFNEDINILLQQMDYLRLYRSDRDKVIPDLKFAAENDLFHGDVTAWLALTHDVRAFLD